jgi:hypothetical protein
MGDCFFAAKRLLAMTEEPCRMTVPSQKQNAPLWGAPVIGAAFDRRSGGHHPGMANSTLFRDGSLSRTPSPVRS